MIPFNVEAGKVIVATADSVHVKSLQVFILSLIAVSAEQKVIANSSQPIRNRDMVFDHRVALHNGGPDLRKLVSLDTQLAMLGEVFDKVDAILKLLFVVEHILKCSLAQLG